MTISVKFWGVRGSIPCPEPCFMRFGGNTISMEINIDGFAMVLDMGSGALPLGRSLNRRTNIRNPHNLPVFFSHFHLDHLIGLPFFAPLYHNDNIIIFYGAPQAFNHPALEQCLSSLIAPPYFPIELSSMPATLAYVDHHPAEMLIPFPEQPDICVQTFQSYHNDGCIGFRFGYRGKAIGVLCDFMPPEDEKQRAQLIEVLHGVDILVFDAAFTPEQYALKKTWGHASWKQAIEWKNFVAAKKVLLLHYDIVNDDDTLDQEQRKAQAIDPAAQFVREGERWVYDGRTVYKEEMDIG